VKQRESYTLVRQQGSSDTWQGYCILMQDIPTDAMNAEGVPQVEIKFQMEMRLEEEQDP